MDAKPNSINIQNLKADRRSFIKFFLVEVISYVFVALPPLLIYYMHFPWINFVEGRILSYFQTFKTLPALCNKENLRRVQNQMKIEF